MKRDPSKIGLFFGSFNPIHIGHLIIANHFVSQADLAEIWFVVSPQNPLKSQAELAPDQKRLQMVQLAVEDNPQLRASDVEFGLGRPSYTVKTLEFLRQQHPDQQFVLIMGGDNLAIFHKWRGYEEILTHHEVYAYARPGAELHDWPTHQRISVFTEMQMNISATHIRQCIREEKSIRYLTPDAVAAYIGSERLYRGAETAE